MLSEPRPAKVGKWSEPALRVLRERYLLRKDGQVAETPEEMCWRVAVSIAEGEARYGRSPAAVQEVATAFYEVMVDGYFIPNSPTLMNAGKGNGLQYSACYVLPVGDSMEEIFDSVKAAAIIHKSGGGTGFAFSRLRPKDDLVASTGGRASGPVSFLKVFNGATDNAGGVAAVLAIGRALARRPLSRPVVLALWDAEEDGLVGSIAYVGMPAVPIADTIAYLNLDIVGSSPAQGFRRATFLLGIDTSPAFPALVASVTGYVTLVAGITLAGLMYWVIDPKLRAVSAEYEKQQAAHLERMEKITRWEKHE